MRLLALLRACGKVRTEGLEVGVGRHERGAGLGYHAVNSSYDNYDVGAALKCGTSNEWA
jgi:hypothetical protein